MMMVKVWKSGRARFCSCFAILSGFVGKRTKNPSTAAAPTQLSGSMWNVPATESIRKHCFNGQGHKSLSPPISTISDTHAFRPLASSPRLDLNWGIWDGSRWWPASTGMTLLFFVFSCLRFQQLVVSHYSISPIYEWEIHFPIVFFSLSVVVFASSSPSIHT